MDKITAINKIKQKGNLWAALKPIISKFMNILEIMIVLSVWLLIYLNRQDLGGLSLEEMVAYILVGNLLGFLSGYILERIFKHEISNNDLILLVKKPLSYISKNFIHGFAKFLPSFISLAAFDIGILYFFLDDLHLNLGINNLMTILAMIALSFVLEFLIAYLLHMLIFWTFEAGELFEIIVRLKKLISGGYFPLSLLPAAGFSLSLIFPFAYSFFVPTGLLLNKISPFIGLMGIFIQLIWIVFFYIFIRILWTIRLDPKRKRRY